MAKPGDFDFYCEKVLSGTVSVKAVYESEHVLAYYHTKPVAPTHIVVIPKAHIHDLRSVSSEILVEIMDVLQRLAQCIDTDRDGARVLTNLGTYQDTPHLHFHLLSDGPYADLKL